MEDKKKEQLESADERAKKFTALPKFTTGGIIALILGILIFAGVFAHIQGYEWLKAFDYSTLIGIRPRTPLSEPAASVPEPDSYLLCHSSHQLCWLSAL